MIFRFFDLTSQARCFDLCFHSDIIKIMKGFGKEVGNSLTLGFELVVPTLLCALVGHYADIYFHSDPIGFLIGIFLGGAAGFWNVVKRYLS